MGYRYLNADWVAMMSQDDRELLQDLYNLFAEQCGRLSEFLAQIPKNPPVDSQAANALADLLHKTRGSASSLGILHIPDAMRALEAEVRSGAAWDSVESTLRTLHSQLNEALGEFRSYIEAQAGR